MSARSAILLLALTALMALFACPAELMQGYLRMKNIDKLTL